MSRWGTLIAASLPALLASCTRGEAPRPEPPASAPLPTGLADFLPVLDLPSYDNRLGSLWRFNVTEAHVPYGKGTMVVRRFTPSSEGAASLACPLALNPLAGCGTSSIAGLPPRQLTRPWTTFAGGSDAVFAQTPCDPSRSDCERGAQSGDEVYRIGSDGVAALWARDPRLLDSLRVWVAEVAERSFALRLAPTGDLALFEAVATMPAQPVTLSEPVALPIRRMHPARPTASAARHYADAGHKVMFGEPSFVALPGKDAWAMAWLEVVPPPPGVGRAPDEYSRAGCGGPPSRRLSHRTVGKKAHVTRFEGTRLSSDKVVWSSDDLNPERTLLVTRLEGDHVEVSVRPNPRCTPEEALPIARLASWPPPACSSSSPAVLPMQPDEQALGAAFDPASREGVLAFRAGDRLFYRRFDEQGRLLGVTLPYLDLTDPDSGQYLFAVDRQPPLLARAGGRWIASHTNGTTMLALGERTAPALTEPHESTAVGLVSGTPHALRISQHEGKLFTTPIDHQGKTAGPTVEALKLPGALNYPKVRVVQLAGAPPMVIARASVSPGQPSPAYAWAWLTPASAWNFPPDELSGLAALNDDDLLLTRDDVVITLSNKTQRRLHWLRAGRGVELPAEPPEPLLGPWGPFALASPLLRDKAKKTLFALAPSPGPLLPADGLPDAVRDCHTALPTSEGTLVLVCSRAVDPVAPGVQVGLRTFRLAPQPR